jgi:predicted nucleic acid-binding protein
MTAANASHGALAEALEAALLTDDHRLVEAPTFPTGVNVLRLAIRP